MINNNRTVENTWNMLQYLYDELRNKRFRNFDITGIKTIDDLYAAVIARWCTSIAKEGLYKEYVEVENEELTSPKGQINIQMSMALQTRSRGTLICSYDELSENIYINHVLKGALQYLLYDSEIDKEVKNSVQKAMQLFNGVEYVDINFIHWKDIKFNNNNIRYKNLIEVCKNVVTERKLEKASELDDNKRLYLLFKKQIIKWYKVKYGETDDVELFEQPYTMIENEPYFETRMHPSQRLIAIKNERQALLICVRLQDEKLLDDATLGRKQANEMVKYLREYMKTYKIKVSGCLVYVNTDDKKLNLNPITINVIDDFVVGETTVDIHDQWRFISNKLEDTYKYFIQRGKNRKK